MAEAYEFPGAWDYDREIALQQPLSVLRAWRDIIRRAVLSDLWRSEEESGDVMDACENAPWFSWPQEWHEWKRDILSDCALVGHPHAIVHQARLKIVTRYELIIQLVAEKERAEIKALKLEAAA